MLVFSLLMVSHFLWSLFRAEQESSVAVIKYARRIYSEQVTKELHVGRRAAGVSVDKVFLSFRVCVKEHTGSPKNPRVILSWTYRGGWGSNSME